VKRSCRIAEVHLSYTEKRTVEVVFELVRIGANWCWIHHLKCAGSGSSSQSPCSICVRFRLQGPWRLATANNLCNAQSTYACPQHNGTTAFVTHDNFSLHNPTLFSSCSDSSHMWTNQDLADPQKTSNFSPCHLTIKNNKSSCNGTIYHLD